MTATVDEVPTLRVDVYAYGPDCFAFQDAILWRDNLVVGFGSHIHAISLRSRGVDTVVLGSYYGHLYPTPDYLLIASGERIFRMDPDRSIRWQSDILALDGVLVRHVGPPVIRGEGEWDPPGGWRDFALFADNGEAAEP